MKISFDSNSIVNLRHYSSRIRERGKGFFLATQIYFKRLNFRFLIVKYMWGNMPINSLYEHISRNTPSYIKGRGKQLHPTE